MQDRPPKHFDIASAMRSKSLKRAASRNGLRSEQLEHLDLLAMVKKNLTYSHIGIY